MFYYFIAFKNRPNPTKKLVISVPSGNFGNICAGIVSNKMGLPINHFIASTNSNDTVLNYLNSGNYIPKKSIQTISMLWMLVIQVILFAFKKFSIMIF